MLLVSEVWEQFGWMPVLTSLGCYKQGDPDRCQWLACVRKVPCTQGSVTTRLKCSDIFGDNFVTNLHLLPSFVTKEF